MYIFYTTANEREHFYKTDFMGRRYKSLIINLSRGDLVYITDSYESILQSPLQTT